MKNISFTLIIAFLLSACGSEPTGLEAKQSELKAKKEAMSALRSEIDKLEAEIAELDTTLKDLGIAVVVDTVAKETFKNPFTFQGLVASDMNVNISPEVPSKLMKIHVREGQKVYKGQVVATLDGSAAQSQIEELKTALELAKTNYEKQERLWKQQIGSQIQYLSAKNNYERLQKSLQSAQVQLGKFVLRSPINGTVDEIMANEGQIVGAIGSQAAVLRVVNLNDIEIKANVSEKYITTIKAGQEVEIYYPNLNSTVMEKITAVGNVIDANNRTFVVTIKPRNKGNYLKPNLLAMVTASDFIQENSITVPTKLIRNDGKGDYILTVGDDNKVKKTPLEIEKQFPTRTVIKAGISEGDLVIVEGYNNVIAGDLTRIVEAI